MTPARPRTGRLSVGIVTPGWSAPDGEPALPALSDLVDRLAVDHDVRVVALRYPPVVGAYARGGIAVYPLAGGARAGPLGRGFLLGRAVETLRRMHATRPFDLLHAFWADEAGAAAVVAGRLLRLPVIVSVLGGELQALDDIGYGSALGRGGRWTVRLTLRGADLVTAGSTPLAQAIEIAAPRTRVELHPLGVDLAVFASGNEPVAPGADVRFLFVGSLEPVKDPVTLMRAFALTVARRPGARIDIVGDGALRTPLERLARALGIAEAVTFHGRLPRHELPAMYRAADLLVISSRHEAQSMVAIEAAACGLPVVGTRVGAVVDLEAAGAAVTMPPLDHVALAEAILGLASDRERRAAMNMAGVRLVHDRYGLATTVARLWDTYAHLVQRAGTRTGT